jgi:hypothetical protein
VEIKALEEKIDKKLKALKNILDSLSDKFNSQKKSII